MGVYADFISHCTVMDKTEPQVAIDRVAYNELLRLQNELDPVRPSAFDAANEVQTIPTFNGTVSGGNFTITIYDPVDGSNYQTANIVYNANQATIESAIDTACTGNITGWTNGDISVALTGDLTANAATLTYDGNSVDGVNVPTATIEDVDLSGGGTVDPITTTTNGQGIRYGWAVMMMLGLISPSDLPAQGLSLGSGVTLWAQPSENARYPSAALRGVLADQAAIDDNNETLRSQLKTLFRIQ